MAASVSALDLRRRAQIVEGKPNEHDGEVIVQNIKDFDVQKTIFKTVSAEMMPMIRDSFAKELFWSDKAVAKVEARTSKILAENPKLTQLKSPSPELLQFMEEECEFNIEHADGSFMDHLHFCYVYGSVHMPCHSSIPLFLHSIMGVGTNLFPMKLEQKSKLSALVTAEDLVHIEAFPTVLRLLNSRLLLDDLLTMSADDLSNIDGLECCRLLGPGMDHDGQVGKSDNSPVRLDADQLWLHLNYQLVHTMDFLPPSQWKEMLSSSLLHVFIDLHHLLKRAGKLMSTVNFDSDKWAEEVVGNQTPEALQAVERFKAFITGYSEKIGHSLDYKITFKAQIRQSKL